ncbi:MAG: hypothetical protein MJ219_03665 [Mycoplasmoidaceae bacterium]|nr:hypothetical protein [Mycoplasmoidaceae bacterium]
MLQKRLDAFKLFKKLKNPKWGPDLSHIDFDEYTYYVSNATQMANK